MGRKLHIMQIPVKGNFAHDAMGSGCIPCKTDRMKVRLLELRNKLGLTLEQMAERLPYSVSQLSRWEAHKSSIPSKNLPALATAYECRVGQIFSEDDGMDAASTLPNAEQLSGMIHRAMSALPVGVSYADYPSAVSSHLHEQLVQFVAAGGYQVDLGPGTSPGKGARPPRATKTPSRAKSHRQ